MYARKMSSELSYSPQRYKIEVFICWINSYTAAFITIEFTSVYSINNYDIIFSYYLTSIIILLYVHTKITILKKKQQ